MICCIEKCGLGAHTPHGFCWVHFTHFVTAAHKPGRVDSLPIKQAIRCRLTSYGCSREELGEILGVTLGEIHGVLLPRRVWVTYPLFDKWATLLHLDVVPMHEAVA